MHVPQFLNTFHLVVHVEIIIPPLPETSLSAPLHLARSVLFQNLHHNSQGRFQRLANQKVNMLRHQHVSGDDEAVPLPHRLKFAFEDTPRRLAFQERLPSITTKGDEMEAAGLLVAHKPFGHDGRSLNPIQPARVRGRPPFARKKAKDGAPALYRQVKGGAPGKDVKSCGSE